MSGVSSTNTLRQSGEFAPEIRSAGKVCKVDEVHVAELTSQYNADVVETPDKIKAFSHRGPNVGEIKQSRWNSTKTQTAKHEEVSFDRQHHNINCADTNSEQVDNHATYKTSKEHDTVEKCLRPGLYANKMTALIEEQRQHNYLSERRKPLGRTPAPSFKVITPVNGFGKSSNTNNYHHHHEDHHNNDDAYKDDSTKGTKSNMHNESHGVASAINAWRDVEPMYLPGEQYDREYDWERMKIDPTTYRFGVNKSNLEKNNDSCNCGANSVFPPASHAVHDDLILVPKLVCDYYKTTSSEIGISKPGVMNNVHSNNTTISIGEPTPVQRKTDSKSNNHLTVREVLTGWAENKPREQGTETGNTENNISVGGINRKLSDSNNNNNEKEQSQSCTNVHDGIQASKMNNETNNNHGSGMKDDVTAEQLLHPCNYVQLGVESKYFAGARSLESIRELCHKAHFPLSDDEINHVYKCVIEREGKCGIEQFKNAAVAMGFM